MTLLPEKIELTGIGGISGIGGSSILVKVGGVSVLLDCGIHAGTSGGQIPKALRDARPDIVLLSHAHIDHVGALPVVAQENQDVPIFATAPTKKLCEPMLFDAMKLSASEGQHPLYTEDEIEKAVASIKTVEFNERFDFRGLKIMFCPAGHILGAAFIVIEGDYRVIYSGDFSSIGTAVTPAPDISAIVQVKSDLLLCETTYGNKPVSPRAEEESRFLKEVREILQGAGRVLIPSFALGRAQEVIALLVTSMRQGELPRVPVYIDGMIKEITEIFVGFPNWLSKPETAKTLSDWEIIKPVESMIDRVTIVFGNEPCVIVAPSGMLSGGWSPTYANDVCRRSDSGIFFVGYLDEESPGRKLKELAEGKITLADGETPVLCQIRKFNLSAHAGHEGIISIVEKIKPLMIVPIHGEATSRWRVSREASQLIGATPIIPYEEQNISIDPRGGTFELILSRVEILSDVFLKSLASPDTTVEDLVGRLATFIDSNGISDYEDLESFFWSVFRLCGNYVSTDPWKTIPARVRFFRACERILFEEFPGKEKDFSRSMEKSLPAFITNLVMYGANRAWLDQLKPVNVTTLDEAEALVVSSWNAFGFSRRVSILKMYFGCSLRVQWPSDEDLEAKFDSIFKPLIVVRSLIDPLERYDWIKTITVDRVVVASFNNEVIIIAILAGEENSPDTLVRDSMEKLAHDRLFQLTGWRLDPSKLRPIVISEKENVPVGMVSQAGYITELSRAVEPLGEKAGGGTLLAFSGLPEVMERLGLDVKLGPEFIEATHSPSNARLLVAVDPTGKRFSRFKEIPGALMSVEGFKFAIRKLTRYWNHKAAADREGLNLATEVITDLDVPGWHSYSPEKLRHEALARGVEIYEFRHVRNELRWLENSWGKNPSRSKYAAVAKDDRLWLENRFGRQHPLEREAFKHEVRRQTGLQFSSTRYDRYIVVNFESETTKIP